ncbi:hypothetical protein DUI87_10086 [Hirundo rustica rustica]|uniref:Uncharacterized protein n=1 Tax=Hirundo rustica rustica TaxID=333673 RepID=A0A3M0KHP0_HIRRU|nr:hypothetical protein DUI87_10086 [Hirundo rustica rustica]
MLIYSQINHNSALGSHNPSLLHTLAFAHDIPTVLVPHSQHSSFRALQSQFTTFFSPYRYKPADVEHVGHTAIHPGRRKEMQDHIVFSPDGKEDMTMVSQHPPNVFKVYD